MHRSARTNSTSRKLTLRAGNRQTAWPIFSGEGDGASAGRAGFSCGQSCRSPTWLPARITVTMPLSDLPRGRLSVPYQRFLYHFRAASGHACRIDRARPGFAAAAHRLRLGCRGWVGRCLRRQHPGLSPLSRRYGGVGRERQGLFGGEPGSGSALLPPERSGSGDTGILHPVAWRTRLLGRSDEATEPTARDRRRPPYPHRRSGSRPHKAVAWAVVTKFPGGHVARSA
jgi:hypothetical protein